jgi:hypothetical protein
MPDPNATLTSITVTKIEDDPDNVAVKFTFVNDDMDHTRVNAELDPLPPEDIPDAIIDTCAGYGAELR